VKSELINKTRALDKEKNNTKSNNVSIIVGCCPSVAFLMKLAKVQLRPYTTVK